MSSTTADAAIPTFDHQHQLFGTFNLRTVVGFIDSVGQGRFHSGGEPNADTLE